MKRLLLILTLMSSSFISMAQSETQLIEDTLNDYLEGTSKAKPDQVRKAFHPDLNLYSLDENKKLKIWKGSDYISGFEGKEASNRLGKILSVDFENDIAMAKAEISYPNNPVVFIDYFMLLKIEGKWTIVHKMYTRKQVD